MFDLTFTTDEMSEDPNVFVPFAVKHKVKMIESRSVNNGHVYSRPERQNIDLARQLKDAGLNVCCLNTPLFVMEYSRLKKIGGFIRTY